MTLCRTAGSRNPWLRFGKIPLQDLKSLTIGFGEIDIADFLLFECFLLIIASSISVFLAGFLMRLPSGSSSIAITSPFGPNLPFGIQK